VLPTFNVFGSTLSLNS